MVSRNGKTGLRDSRRPELQRGGRRGAEAPGGGAGGSWGKRPCRTAKAGWDSPTERPVRGQDARWNLRSRTVRRSQCSSFFPRRRFYRVAF